MDTPIELYKWKRKQRNIQKVYASKYAFVGIGNHSLHNLYPVVDYLRVPLKYIVCKSQRSVDLVKQNYIALTATNDYDETLNDGEIKGVFICANPNSHFELALKALRAKKNVFVEKPVCLSSGDLESLISAEKESGSFCTVGMQKRYSTCTSILKKRLKKDNLLSYNYRFQVGAYPEGNPYWDIFIHPVDWLIFLFGKARILSVVETNHGKGRLSVMLHLKHDADLVGSVEISTEYGWSLPLEELSVNTEKGVYEMRNHQLLTYTTKPDTFLSIPTEKILPFTTEKQYLFDGNNFLPVFQNNQLVLQGYFVEIQTFVDQCEGKKANNLSSLESLRDTYHILEQIQNQNPK
ncbi:hypothetical protein FACS1894123_02670 [Bacteroidia bacterium]|nr:hypothetical protein FACS1894123_02670 [Bacteroidia bacterium]